MQASTHFFISSKHNQFPHRCNSFLILFAFNLTPWHTSSAVRIVRTFHCDLRSIINTGTSRKRKKDCKLLVELVQIVKTVHQPLGIMGIQEIKKHIVILLHIHGIATVYHIFKFFFFHCFIKKEIMDSTQQRVVHDRIIFISLQPLACIMPDFPQKINIRLYRF